MNRFDWILGLIACAFIGCASAVVTDLARPAEPATIEYHLSPRDQHEMAELAARTRSVESRERTYLAVIFSLEGRLAAVEGRPVRREWPFCELPTVEVPAEDRIPPQNVPVPANNP